jgi:hypothetical protein
MSILRRLISVGLILEKGNFAGWNTHVSCEQQTLE